MKVRLIRSYRSKNGHVTFVYAVSGTKDQLASYKETQGDFYREDDKTGSPLWFTTRCIGQTGTLLITTNGNVVPDMSKFDQAASLASQYGGNFGQELAKAAAAMLTGATPVAEATTALAPEPLPEDTADLSNM